jgi:hypothetical protein
MAVWSVKKEAELGWSAVLAPERYDPRREFAIDHDLQGGAVLLGEFVKSVRKTVGRKNAPPRCIVMDTCDASEGLVVGIKPAVDGSLLGSTKKVVERNVVVISRLRPYLRQVAFVDPSIDGWEDDVALLCSTEFFVLRSADEQSVAFLVPFLLSEPVQKVLAASQEGGHHPRFNESTLLSLPIPTNLLEERGPLSATIEEAVRLYRESEKHIALTVEAATLLMAGHIGTSPITG